MRLRANEVMRWTGIGLVLAVLALGPFFKGLFFWTELLFAQAVVSLGFALWLLARQRSLRPVNLIGGVTGGALLVLAGCYAVLLPFALYARGDIDWLLRTISAWQVFIMFREESTPAFRRLFAWVFVGSMTAVAALGLAQYTGMFARDPEVAESLSLVNLSSRLYGSFQYPNTAAIMFLMGVVIAVGLAVDAVARGAFSAGSSSADGASASADGVRTRMIIVPGALAVANLMIIAFFFALSRGAVLVLPLALVLLLIGMPRGAKWPTVLILGIVIVPALVALRGVGANSAIANYISAWRWIAASVVATAVGGVVLVPFLELRWKWQIGAGLVGIAVLVLTIAVMVGGQARGVAGGTGGKNKPLLGLLPSQTARLLDMNLNTVNVRMRLIYDATALRILADRPLGSGGWGWDRSYRRYQDFNYVARETHNQYLQTAVEAGVPGAVALVVAIATALVLTLRRRSQVLVWAPAVALAALVAHSAVDFNLSYGAVWLLLWAQVGGASSLRGVDSAEPAGPPIHEEQQRRSIGWLPPRRSGLVVVLTCALCVVMLDFGYATALGSKAEAALVGDRVDAAANLYQTAVVLDPFNGDLWRGYGNAERALGNGAQAEIQLRRAESVDPRLPSNSYELANTLAFGGDYAEAAEAAQRALNAQPMLAEHYELAGRLLSTCLENALVSGDTASEKKAADSLVHLGQRVESAIETVARNRNIAHWSNLQWSPALLYAYGQGLFMTGDLVRAEDALLKAGRDALVATQSDVWLYALYQQTGNQKKADAMSALPWIRYRQSNPVYGQLVKY